MPAGCVYETFKMVVKFIRLSKSPGWTKPNSLVVAKEATSVTEIAWAGWISTNATVMATTATRAFIPVEDITDDGCNGRR